MVEHAGETSAHWFDVHVKILVDLVDVVTSVSTSHCFCSDLCPYDVEEVVLGLAQCIHI